MQTAFSSLDAAIIVVYLAVLTGVGVYFSRRQTHARRVLPRAAVDGVAAGRPVADGGAQQRHRLPDAAVGDDPLRPGPARRHQSWLFLYPWVARVTLPFYRRLNSTPRTSISRRASTCACARSPPASSSSGGSAGWRRRSTCRAWRSTPRPAGGFDSPTMIVVLGVHRDALHDARRHPGGDLERRDPVLHHVRRPRRRRSWIAARTCRAALREIWRVGARGRQDDAASRRSPDRRGGAARSQVQAFFEQPINVVAIMFALVLGRMAATRAIR